MCLEKFHKILEFIGLFFNIIGTILIWFDNQKTFNEVSNLLKEVASCIGFWVDDPIENNKINNFDYTINESIKYQKRGFVLLLLGFLLQLISFFF